MVVNCSPARTGAWLAWPVVEGSEPLREFEVEYVRADLHRGAVERAYALGFWDGAQTESVSDAKLPDGWQARVHDATEGQ